MYAVGRLKNIVKLICDTIGIFNDVLKCLNNAEFHQTRYAVIFR